MDCETCKEKRKVIAQTPKVARLERVIKRLWVLVLVLIVLLAASNAAWLYYESSFEEIRIEQDNEFRRAGTSRNHSKLQQRHGIFPACKRHGI